MSFVSADDVQKQLQNAIIGHQVGNVKFVDQIVGNNDQYYWNHQTDYGQPKVHVTSQVSNDGNSITYHVTIDGDYQGFKTNMQNGNERDFIMTLISWKPTDSSALLPPADVTDPTQDVKKVIYEENGTYPNGCLVGYPVWNQALKDYLKDKPWIVHITSPDGFNYSETKGYWIDRSTDIKPANNGYVANHFYGWLKQTIYYVDENGNAMKNASGQVMAPEVRQVTFESKDDTNDFAGLTQEFSDIPIPHIDGYTAYVGVKNGDYLQINNGRAVTIGSAVTSYGAEATFGYPHANFVEYIVYKSDPDIPQQNLVTIHYIDVDQTAKADPNKKTFTAGDGNELEQHKQVISGKNVGDSYTNTLWNYVAAHYVLATDSIDPKTEGGHIPEIGQPTDFYVYLKHATENISGSQTVKETIHYLYQNGPHAGQKVADDYTAARSFARTDIIDNVTGDVVTYGVWNEVAPFSEVKSPEIDNYTADKLLVPEMNVTPDLNDIVVNVHYTMISHPDVPNNPDNPVVPKHDDQTSNEKDHPVIHQGKDQTDSSAGQPSSQVNDHVHQGKLPQTGNSQMGEVSLGI